MKIKEVGAAYLLEGASQFWLSMDGSAGLPEAGIHDAPRRRHALRTQGAALRVGRRSAWSCRRLSSAPFGICARGLANRFRRAGCAGGAHGGGLLRQDPHQSRQLRRRQVLQPPSLALLSHRTRPLPPRTPDWFRFNGDTWTMSRKTFKEINYDNPADYQARIRPARYPRHGGFRGRCSSPAAHTACGVLWGGLRVVFTGDARDASLRDGRQKKRWRDEGGESTQAGAAGGNRRSWTTSRRRSRRSSSSASRHAAFTPTRKRAPCLACRLVSDSLCRRSWSGGQYRSRRRRRSRGWAVSRQGCRGLACSCCCAFTSVEDAGRDAHPVPTNQPRACAARLPLARARGEAALRGDGGGSASVEGHVSKGETRDGGGVRGRGSWGARCASGPTTGRSRRGRSPTTATRRRAWSSPPSSSPAYAGPHHAPRAPQAAMASAGKGWAVSSLAGVRGRGRRAE